MIVPWLFKLFHGASIALACVSSGITVDAAQSVTMAWHANTETNLAGYRLYQGLATRSYSTGYVQVLHPVTQATVANLAVGPTNYFAVTAFTSDGLESDYSNEVSYSVPRPPPERPINLRLVTTLQAATSPTGPWTNAWKLSQQIPLPAHSPASMFYRSQAQLLPMTLSE